MLRATKGRTHTELHRVIILISSDLSLKKQNAGF